MHQSYNYHVPTDNQGNYTADVLKGYKREYRQETRAKQTPLVTIPKRKLSKKEGTALFSIGVATTGGLLVWLLFPFLAAIAPIVAIIAIFKALPANNNPRPKSSMSNSEALAEWMCP